MKKQSKITDLLAMMVLLVFAVCILLVLLTGTKVYKRLMENGGAGFSRRTGIQYIATRTRQAKDVSVADFEGCSALVIPEEIDGENYTTLVYWYDGYICELFTADPSGMYPEDGERVIRSEKAFFSMDGSLITARIGSDQVYLDIPAEKEIPV